MSGKLVKKKKTITALATIGIIGGVTVLAFFLVKKHSIKINSIIEDKVGDKIISKKYLMNVGLRYVEVTSKPDEKDNFVLKEPVFTYTFDTIEEKDKDGIPKVEVTIKNKLNKKENKIILDDALPN